MPLKAASTSTTGTAATAEIGTKPLSSGLFAGKESFNDLLKDVTAVAVANNTNAAEIEALRRKIKGQDTTEGDGPQGEFVEFDVIENAVRRKATILTLNGVYD